MRALRVVGMTEGGDVVLEDSGRRERFTVPADEQLRAAARGDMTRLGQIAIELESQLRPREIQARIRAGASVEQVASAAGVPIQKIERFAYPVLLERSRTAEVAQRAHPVRADGPDVRTLGDVVAHTFGLRGQEYTEAEWDSWKGEDGRWVVALSWRAGRSDNRAHWTFQPGAHGGTVTAVDEHASDLVEGLPARPLRPVGPVIDIARPEDPAPGPQPAAELRATGSDVVRDRGVPEYRGVERRAPLDRTLPDRPAPDGPADRPGVDRTTGDRLTGDRTTGDRPAVDRTVAARAATLEREVLDRGLPARDEDSSRADRSAPVLDAPPAAGHTSADPDAARAAVTPARPATPATDEPAAPVDEPVAPSATPSAEPAIRADEPARADDGQVASTVAEPAGAQPAAGPAVGTPAVETPAVEAAAETAPAEASPAETPPAETPPTETPRADEEPAAAEHAPPAQRRAEAEAPTQAPSAEPAPRRTRKGKPVMPSWDEVLLGVRGQR